MIPRPRQDKTRVGKKKENLDRLPLRLIADRMDGRQDHTRHDLTFFNTSTSTSSHHQRKNNNLVTQAIICDKDKGNEYLGVGMDGWMGKLCPF